MRWPETLARARERLGVSAGDVALAVALACFAEVEVWLGSSYRGADAVNSVLVLVMALALVWRRRRPLLVLAVVMAGIAVQSLAYGGSETGSLLLIAIVAVYSAAAYSSSIPLAAALTLAGALAHDLLDPEANGIGASLFSSIAFGLVFLFGVAMRVRHRRELAAEARATLLEAEQQRARQAAVDERRRLAQELHDIVAHGLGVMVLQAGAAEQVLETSPDKARAALRSIRETGQESIDEMGRLLGLIRDDRPTSLEPQPTLSDLEPLLRKAAETGLAVELSIEGKRRTLPAALELSAFRIVQEGLTNVLKHAQASHAWVVIRYRESDLELEVADDGSGAERSSGSGYGLTGLRERVALFGGRLEVGQKAGGGWTLRAVLPVDR